MFTYGKVSLALEFLKNLGNSVVDLISDELVLAIEDVQFSGHGLVPRRAVFGRPLKAGVKTWVNFFQAFSVLSDLKIVDLVFQ